MKSHTRMDAERRWPYAWKLEDLPVFTSLDCIFDALDEHFPQFLRRCVRECVCACVRACVRVCVRECVSEWVGWKASTWVDECVSGWVSEWVGRWVLEWMSAWVDEWTSAWMSKYLTVPQFLHRWVSGWGVDYVMSWNVQWITWCNTLTSSNVWFWYVFEYRFGGSFRTCTLGLFWRSTMHMMLITNRILIWMSCTWKKIWIHTNRSVMNDES